LVFLRIFNMNDITSPNVDYQSLAVNKLKFTRSQLLALLIAPVLTIILMMFLNQITFFWGEIFQFFLFKMGISNVLITQNFQITNFLDWKILYPTLPGSMPSYATWWISFFVTLGLLCMTLYMPKKLFPIKVFICIIVTIHAGALLYFWLAPNDFPYYLPQYLSNGLLQGIVLLFLTPWILSLTYYLYGHSVVQKIIFTLLLEIYFILFIPLQYLLHGLAIYYFSLLYMPMLYILFGILPNVFMIVVFFSLGASMQKRKLGQKI